MSLLQIDFLLLHFLEQGQFLLQRWWILLRLRYCDLIWADYRPLNCSISVFRFYFNPISVINLEPYFLWCLAMMWVSCFCRDFSNILILLCINYLLLSIISWVFLSWEGPSSRVSIDKLFAQFSRIIWNMSLVLLTYLREGVYNFE